MDTIPYTSEQKYYIRKSLLIAPHTGLLRVHQTSIHWYEHHTGGQKNVHKLTKKLQMATDLMGD